MTRNPKKAASLTEYPILVIMVALALIVTVVLFRHQIFNMFFDSAGKVESLK